MRTPAPISALALVAALAACSDDSSGKQDADSTGDGPVRLDSGADTGATSDMPPGGSCDPDCASQASYLCVKDSDGSCMECNSDADCQGNPNALGNVCDTTGGICTCAADADCAGSPWGSKCDSEMQFCACAADTDCPSPTACTGTLFGKQVCSTPCTADTDCTSTTAPKCNTADGRCVECLADGDCAGSVNGTKTKCDSNTSACVACLADGDCADSMDGAKCTGGRCGCAADTDCAGSHPWGNTCIDFSTGKRCGCDADASCSGNANGPTCYTTYKKCSCANDTECTDTPYDTCSLPYSGAAYSHCQKACTSSADCTASASLPNCDTGSGRCVECLADTDCGSSTKTKCDGNNACVQCLADSDCSADPTAPYCLTGECVECKADSDCAGNDFTVKCDTATGGCKECLNNDADCGDNALGPHCDTSYCVCANNAECASNVYGKLCDGGNAMCSCATDSDCPGGKACSGSYFNTSICN